MITATSSVKSVSQGTGVCATEVGLAPPVRDWSRSGTPSARLKSVWSEPIFGLDQLIRADFGMDSLIRAGLDLAPHPGIWFDLL